jgi:exodeoxyribonuclease VII small subunit
MKGKTMGEKKERKFENALKELEKIVKELEKNDLALEHAIQLFEKGIELSTYCHKKLNEAEKKIQILMKKLDGAYEIKPFLPEKDNNE